MKDKPRSGDPPIPVDLIIPMVPEMELTATKTAGAVGEFMGLEEQKIDEVKMALIEACINAFEHSDSEDRRINISFEIGDDELTVLISDRGQGFDLRKVREKMGERHRKQHRGWGLTIMEALMDEVQIQTGDDGTTISMKKKR